MDFKELQKLIITGHDIEFKYNNNKYSIIKGPDGFYFTDVQNQKTLGIYSSELELIIKSNINGKNLKDISKYIKDIIVY